MSVSASPKLVAYAALAAAGLVAGVLSGEADIVALALPFGVLCAAGLALARHPSVAIELALDRDRVLEGDDVVVDLVLRSDVAVEADVAVLLEPGLMTAEETSGRDLRLEAGRPLDARIRLSCERWGLYRPGLVDVRATDRLGLFFYRAVADRRRELRVYPQPQQVRALVPPRDTQALTGDLVSRAKGEGIEFADIRQFATGDRVRRINWNVSARRGALHVNEYRPERNSEVVLFLDSFTELEQSGGTTLDRAVGAMATLAERYLRRRDRVGLVCYGGTLSWLTPASSAHQLYRIIDALLDTSTFATAAWRDVTVLPRQMLPSRALILALSPLLDRRSVSALLDLRSRGFDVVIVELTPQPPSTGPTDPDQLALRLWNLRRRSLHALCESAGALIVQWPPETPLAAALEEANEWRRTARRLPA